MVVMSTGPPDPIGHLRKARDDLGLARAQIDTQLELFLRTRRVIDARIRDLDELIEKFGEALPDPGVEIMFTGSGKTTAIVELKRAAGAFEASDMSTSTRTAILRLLATEDRPFETTEIVERVQTQVGSQPTTTRSLLSKMADKNQIQRVRRGWYQLGPITDPAVGSGSFQHEARKYQARLIDTLQRMPTPEEFMAMRSDPDEEPDYDPPEHDEPDLSAEDYRQWNNEVEQAHLEDQADREETSS